jgi:hypothetical protein
MPMTIVSIAFPAEYIGDLHYLVEDSENVSLSEKYGYFALNRHDTSPGSDCALP